MLPGESWYDRIDGIAISNGIAGEVFKVKSFFDSAFGIKVYNNTVVVGESFWPFSNDFIEIFGGGWKNETSLKKVNKNGNKNWNQLFERVGIHP